MEYKHKLAPGVWVKIWKSINDPHVFDSYTLVFYGRKEGWEAREPQWRDQRIHHFWRACSDTGIRCVSGYEPLRDVTGNSRPVPWDKVPDGVKKACDIELQDDKYYRGLSKKE